MQLRRLTKFSRIELETEKSELQRLIEELDLILSDDKQLRKVVSDELAEVAKAYGTPRRTVLLESAGQSPAAVPLEVADDPCWVYLSSTGLLARTTDAEPPGSGGARGTHDVIVVRGAVDRPRPGRRAHLDRQAGPARRARPPHRCRRRRTVPHLQGGQPISTFLALEGDERVLSLCGLSGEGPGVALGTAQGVVKRVTPEVLNRDSWELLRLDDGDEVVGAVELVSGEEELCFVTSDAQLLHFPAGGVRPQGRSGGGIAGVRLAPGARVVFFGAVDPPRPTRSW